MQRKTSPFFNEKRKYPFVPKSIGKKWLAKQNYVEKIPPMILPKELLFKSQKDKALMFKSIKDNHGNCSSFFIANELTITAFSAELAHQVLVEKANNYIKGNAWNRVRKFAGDGLVTAEQPVHIANRRLMQPNFNHKKIIDQYSKVMIKKTEEKIEDLTNTNRKLFMHEEMVSLVFNIVLEALFNVKDTRDSSSVQKNMQIAMDAVERTIASGLDRYDFTNLPIFKGFRKSSLELHDFAMSLIEERKSNMDDSDDLLTFLIQSNMTPQQISDEVLTIILAGFETTANTLSWIFSYLNNMPEMYEKLILESDYIYQSKNSEDFLNLIDNSLILNGIVKETLRLNPSLWVLPRMAKVDTELNGYFIPKGANVIVSPFVIHRDESIYKDANLWNPDRWTIDFEKDLPRGSYIPFSGGNRKCIGDQFAMLEIKIILVLFTHYFKIKTHGKFPKAEARGTYRLSKKMKISIEQR
jgi:cytochrome P450